MNKSYTAKRLEWDPWISALHEFWFSIQEGLFKCVLLIRRRVTDSEISTKFVKETILHEIRMEKELWRCSGEWIGWSANSRVTWSEQVCAIQKREKRSLFFYIHVIDRTDHPFLDWKWKYLNHFTMNGGGQSRCTDL